MPESLTPPTPSVPAPIVVAPPNPAQQGNQQALASRWDATEKSNQPSKTQSTTTSGRTTSEPPAGEIDLDTLERIKPTPNTPTQDEDDNDPEIVQEGEVKDKKVEELVKQEEQQKVEPAKVEEEQVPAGEKKVEPSDGRDYTKFPSELTPLLKKLPNKAFNYAVENIVPVFEKVKTLEVENTKLKADYEHVKSGKLPEAWMEHPEAVKLTPQYKELETALTYDEFEESHWTKQLIAIKQGKPWQKLLGYNEKTGQAQLQNVPAVEGGMLDSASDVQISNLLHQLQAQKQQRLSQLNYLAQSHTQGYQQAVGNIKKAQDQFFPSYADESKLTPEVKARFGEVAANLPPVFRGHPLVGILQRAYDMLVQGKAQVAAWQKEKALLESKLEDFKKAGPSKQAFNAGGGSGKGGGRMLDIKDFD